MSRRPRFAQLLFKLTSAFVVLTILTSNILPPLGSSLPGSAAGGPVEAAAGAEAEVSVTGRLQFSPTVDTDGNPGSNPSPAIPVPVHRLGTAGATDAVKYATLALAAELTPDDPNLNPAGVTVAFHIWNETAGINVVKQARADAWGAASVELVLDDLHLDGRFHYQASAPGFGQTLKRTFTLDNNSYLSDTQLGAARLVTHVEPDGRLLVAVLSDLPIDDSPLAVQLTAVRLTPDGAGGVNKELLPPLLARRVDPNQARTEIYLDPGDYILTAVAHSGSVQAQSQPAHVHIEQVALPPIAAVEQLGDFTAEGDAILVNYRTPNGDAALLTRPLADLPPASQQPAPTLFQETFRVGPFQWRTQTYSTTIETIADDGKKLVTLADFNYDPIARSYDIQIESLMDAPMEDKITVQVFGPNGVLIYEETNPIWLDPAEPLHYKVTVPTHLGEPYGLRIIVHDPSIFEWAIEKLSDTMTSVFRVLDSAVPPALARYGFTLEASFKLSLEVVKIDLAVASILCNRGLCAPIPAKGLFFKEPSEWPKIITDGVRDWLRQRYSEVLATDDMDAIIKKLGEGISLGSFSLTAVVGARFNYTVVDPNSCASAASIEAAKNYVKQLGANLSNLGKTITFRFKTVSEMLQSKGKISFTVPGAWFLGMQIGPVLAFKVEGDVDPLNSFAIFVNLVADIGGKAELKLKAAAIYDILVSLLNARVYVIGVYRFIEIAKLGHQLLVLGTSAAKYSGTGGCTGGGGGSGRGNPPRPYSRPDDRLDAFQEEFLPYPTGVSGEMAYLQQQLALAEQAGLPRAATYWRLLLREQELAAFELDTAKAISHTEQLDTIFAASELQMRGLISGTILPEPGQTITDAVRQVYDDYLLAIVATDYDLEREALADALEFAEKQYNDLRGQELELQRELRQMLAAGGVGVVDSGLVVSAIEAFSSLGIPVRPVQILPGSTSSFLPESRYYSPYEAPAVLIVPSGGLYRLFGSQQAEDWLATYTALGGTLVVLAQAAGTDWEMLPGGEVRGLGYLEDILCKDSSVQIINASEWITGIGHDYPNIQVDGSFTAWPAEATIILMRTTGNKMPAMIEYPYGLGRVVAMSAYPDSVLNSLQSGDDVVFARTLFSLTYLLGTGQSVAANVDPEETFTVNVTITNTAALSVTEVTVWSDYFGGGLNNAWRWNAEKYRQLYAEEVIPLDPPLASGESRQVAFTLTAPLYFTGIFRLGYFLGRPDTWMGSGTMAGPFYQVQSAAVTADLFNFKLSPDQSSYPYGATANLVATIHNDQDTPRTFLLQPISGLDTFPVYLDVDPYSTAAYTFTTTVEGSRLVRMEAIDLADYETVSVLVAQLSLRLPTIGLSGSPSEMVAGLEASGQFTATTTNLAAGTPITWEVRHNGSLLLETTTPLAAGPGYQTAPLNINLPAAEFGTAYTVRAALPNGLAITRTIAVVAPATIMDASLFGQPIIGETNPDTIFVLVQDAGYTGTVAIQAILEHNFVPFTAGTVVTSPIGDGFQLLTLELPLPPAFTLYDFTNVVISATSQISGASQAYPDTFYLGLPLQGPDTTLADSSRRVGETLAMILTAVPGTPVLPEFGPYEVALRDDNADTVYTTVVSEAVTINGNLVVSITVPPLLRGGEYEMLISSPRLDYWQAEEEWFVPDHRFSYSAPPAVTAGDNLAWTAENGGGVHSSLSGTLSLEDFNGVVLAELAISQTMPLDTPYTALLAVPAQLRDDTYILRWRGRDHLDQIVADAILVQVAGLSITLDSQTDRPAYLSTETVSTTSLIATNLALTNAQLRLQVLKPAGTIIGWDGWRGQYGDGGLTNGVGQTAFAPLTASWMVTPSLDRPPVAIGSQLFTFDYDYDVFQYELVALDAADGSQQWQTGLTAFPYYLVANSQSVFVRDSDQVVTAFETADGSIRWSQTITNGDSLLASETALVIDTYDGDNLNYVLLDPTSGLERGIFPSDDYEFRALLTDDNFYVQNGGTLYAYDSFTAIEQWHTLLPSAGSSVVLLSANDRYVLTAHYEFDPETFDLIFLLGVYDVQDGSLLRQVTLEGFTASYDIPFPLVLRDDTLFYEKVVDGGGDARPIGTSDQSNSPGRDLDEGSYIYAVDLVAGEVALIYSQEEPIYDFIGTGDRLQLLYQHPDLYVPVVQAISAAGDTLSTQTFADECNASELTVTEQGLLLVGSSGSPHCALQAVQPLSSPLGTGVEVIREEWLTVTGSGILNLDLALVDPDLGDDPDARGQLYLQGTLFSAEPAAESDPAARQLLANSIYPFTVDDGSGSLVLNAGQPTYRTNVGGYTADDDEATIDLSGELSNTGPTTADVTLTIERSDGVTVHNQTFNDVASGETRVYSVGDPNPPAGTVVYTATTNLGATAVVTVLVRPALVGAAASFNPGVILLGESAELRVSVHNDGAEPGFVTADWGSGPQLITLAPGAQFLMTSVVTPTSAGLYTQPVSFSGDASGVANIVLDVREETVTAAITLTGVLRESSGEGRAAGDLLLVQGQDAGLSFLVTNPQPFDFDAFIDYSLDGPAVRLGSLPRTLFPGETQLNVPLGLLPAGQYTATVTIRHARLGHVIATATLPFAIVTPIFDLDVAVTPSAIDPWGYLPLAVVATSDYSSEQPWYGTLVVMDGNRLLDRQAIVLYPGNNGYSFAYLEWRSRSGPQPINVSLVADDGTIALAETVLVNAAPNVAPRATLATLTAAPAAPGSVTTLSATVTNDGPAGDAILTFVAFDQEYELIRALPAFGPAVITLDVPVPAGLLAGTYPVLVRLDGQELQTDVAVSGPQIVLRHSLDAAAYLPFTSAVWTVELEGISGSPADYDVSLRYGTQTYSQTVTLGAGEVVTIPWTFDVGPAADRAGVLVQTNQTNDPNQTRHNLLIDTRYVPVIEDSRAWLETDKPSYTAGDVVNLTLHLLRPTLAAAVLAPDNLPNDGLLLWSSMTLTETWTITNPTVIGSYQMVYTLPTTMPTGRYYFITLLEGEERSWPIDVHAITLQAEEMAVAGPAGNRPFLPGDALTVTAKVRLNAPVASARIEAYLLWPDGRFASLGPSAVLTQSLPAGVTPITLNGIMDTYQPGAHQVVLKLFDAASGIMLGGDARYVDVGRATLDGLTTDRGLYTPGQPGFGTISLYGLDTAAVLVTTSDGTPLLSQNVPLTGFQALTFTIPTTTELDEVLVATVTDTVGMTSTLQTAYKVAASLDITAPVVQILSPANTDSVEFIGGSHQVTVSGVLAEAVEIGTVLVNGVTATVTGGTMGSGEAVTATHTWTATVQLELGSNFIEVYALDAAGNASLPDTIAVTGEPSYGIAFTAVPTSTYVDQIVTYTAVITSAEAMSATALFPFSTLSTTLLSGSATTGTLILTGTTAAWEGFVTPGTPVTIQWQGQPTAPVTRTITALTQGPQMLPRLSNPVDTMIRPANPTAIGLDSLTSYPVTPLDNWLIGVVILLGLLTAVAVYRSKRKGEAAAKIAGS